MSLAIDVEVASFISKNYSDRREQSNFVNNILKDYIHQVELTTPEKIDARIEEIKTEAKTEINRLLDLKEAMT